MKKGSIVNKNGILYTVISSTIYENIQYVFCVDKKDNIKIFQCLDELIEVIDIDLIKEIIKGM